jgi:DNA-binding IclR family transcriptional regulator
MILGSVDKALSLMEMLAIERRPMSLGEMASRLCMKPSTLHHLLVTLKRRGFLEQDPATRQYRLGLRALAVGLAVAETLDIRRVAEPHLRRLTEATGETANLAVFDGGAVIYIAQSLPDRVMRTFARLGARVPAHCTGVGKVLMSDLPPGDLRGVIGDGELQRFTPRTLCSVKDLEAELERVRSAGFAVDDGEREEGVTCIAAPVRDGTGRVIAAISVSGPAARLGAGDRTGLVNLVMGAARDLSASLGYAAAGGSSA